MITIFGERGVAQVHSLICDSSGHDEKTAATCCLEVLGKYQKFYCAACASSVISALMWVDTFGELNKKPDEKKPSA